MLPGNSILPCITVEGHKVIGAFYLFKPFVEALGIREAINRVVPMQFDVGRLTHE